MRSIIYSPFLSRDPSIVLLLLDPTAPRRLLRLRTVIERCSGQNVNVVMVRTDRNSMVPTMQVAERSI